MGGLVRVSEETRYLMERVIANLVVLSQSRNLPTTAKVNLKNFKLLVKKAEDLLKDIELKHGI